MLKKSNDNLDWDEILEKVMSGYEDYDETDFLKTDKIESLETQLEIQIKARDDLYTRLLDDYRKITQTRNNRKELHKWIFFWLIVASGTYLVLCIGEVIHRVLLIEDAQMFISAVPVLITSFVSLLASVVTIPLTVTKFLFNEKEDDNITQTIHKTQEHDKSQIMLLLRPQKATVKLDPEGDEISEGSNEAPKEELLATVEPQPQSADGEFNFEYGTNESFDE